MTGFASIASAPNIVSTELITVNTEKNHESCPRSGILQTGLFIMARLWGICEILRSRGTSNVGVTAQVLDSVITLAEGDSGGTASMMARSVK